MEPGEFRTESGKGWRVVSVGTHALKAGAKSELWVRLRQHRGTANFGGGNHRGSIFRKIVGVALIELDGLDCPTWDQYPNTARREVRDAERPTEQDVSRVIGDMPFPWLSVEDEPGPESERGFIERNAIALLSNSRKVAIDAPSRTWLGKHCNREKVRCSGLWNSNHVSDDYDPAFLDTLEDFVRRTEESS